MRKKILSILLIASMVMGTMTACSSSSSGLISQNETTNKLNNEEINNDSTENTTSKDETQSNTEDNTEGNDEKKLTTKDVINLFTPTNEVNTINVDNYYFGRKAISLGKSIDELDVYKIVAKTYNFDGKDLIYNRENLNKKADFLNMQDFLDAKTVINPPTTSTDISIELHFDENNNYILCQPISGNNRENKVTTYDTLYLDIDDNGRSDGKPDYDKIANYVTSYKNIIDRGIYGYTSDYMNMGEVRLCEFLGIDTTTTDGTHLGDLQAVEKCFGQPSYTHYEEDEQGNCWGKLYWIFENTTICVNITPQGGTRIAFVSLTWADGSFYLDYIKNSLE